MKISSSFKIDFGGAEILKNFTASAARRLRLFLIGGDGGSADRLTPLNMTSKNL
jgi:hypothetical protein